MFCISEKRHGGNISAVLFGAETQLVKDLFLGYHKQARPVYDPMEKVNVSVHFTLVQIGDLVRFNETFPS